MTKNISFRNINDFTPEEVIIFVAEKLVEQGVPSYTGGVCAYKYGELKCAAGHLIPDEDYDRVAMEGAFWGTFDISKGIDNVKTDVIHVMRHSHDTLARVFEGRKCFNDVEEVIKNFLFYCSNMPICLVIKDVDKYFENALNIVRTRKQS